MRRTSTGVKDVAARAGVSVGTVSNVLNRPELVAESTRAKVLQAIAELGFVRNESGRQLRAGQSRTIAYVMLDAANPFFTDVAKGIEEVARVHGVALFICNSDSDAAREGDYLELLLQQRVRGRAHHAGRPGHVARSTCCSARRSRSCSSTAVAGASWCSVGVDDVEGGTLAVTHLCEQGHERIAFVGGPMTTVQVADRLRGARQAMAASGRPADSLLVLETAALDVAEGRRAGERIAGLPRARRPTAAFCANDLLALGLLQQMTRHRRRRARRAGDRRLRRHRVRRRAAAVPLSSVRQPRQLLGRTAAELLLAESDADEAHVHQQVLFHPELVVRASSISSTKAGRGTGRAPTGSRARPSRASARA